MENTRMIPVTAVGSGRLNVPPPVMGGPVQQPDAPPATAPGEWPADTVQVENAGAAGPVEVVDDPHVAEVRQQIIAGTYLTPEKLEYVADRLWEVLTESVPNARER